MVKLLDSPEKEPETKWRVESVESVTVEKHEEKGESLSKKEEKAAKKAAKQEAKAARKRAKRTLELQRAKEKTEEYKIHGNLSAALARRREQRRRAIRAHPVVKFVTGSGKSHKKAKRKFRIW